MAKGGKGVCEKDRPRGKISPTEHYENIHTNQGNLLLLQTAAPLSPSKETHATSNIQQSTHVYYRRGCMHFYYTGSLFVLGNLLHHIYQAPLYLGIAIQ